jgi:hypothetical protein
MYATQTLIEKGPTGIKINSDILIAELQDFISIGATYQAKAGGTDDAIMAMAVVMKVMGRLASYDEHARKVVYENVSPDSDMQTEETLMDSFGDEPAPWIM